MKIRTLVLLAALATPSLAADVSSRQRLTPPAAEPQNLTCGVELSKMRSQLAEIDRAWADLYEEHHDRKMAAAYRKDAAAVEVSSELDVNDRTCSSQNMKMLRVMVAEWQFMYAQDYFYLTKEK